MRPVAHIPTFDAESDIRAIDPTTITIVLASIGGIVSLYLSAYQYGLITEVWEPFFGDGSARILHSGILDPISRLLGFPVHDAPFGAAAYFLEAAAAFAWGRVARSTIPENSTMPERSMRGSPWLLAAYGALVVAMGLTGLLLLVLQGAVFQAWCSLCLVSAAVSGIVVLLNRREIAAAVRFLKDRREPALRRRRKG